MDSIVFPCVVLTAAIAIGLALHRRMGTEPTTESLRGFFGAKPTLYWFCDSEKNARHWNDFTARNSEDLNRGYLEVALDALRATQGRDFTIKPLGGRDAILAEIPNADPQAKQLPPALFRLWVIANVCAKRGGLVMDGNSTLCVGPAFSSVLGGLEAATFGVDPDEPLGSAIGPAPAPYVGYAKAAGHPGWRATAAILNSVVAAGPTSWSAAVARRISSQLHEAQQAKGVVCIRSADGGRLPNGQARQLEDLLGRVASPPDPNTALLPGVVYVPYDGDALIRRYEFAWFPRLSKQQIQESDLVWASYAGL
jgi:hypothetical protein